MSVRRFWLGVAATVFLAIFLGAGPGDAPAGPAAESPQPQGGRPASEFAWGGYWGQGGQLTHAGTHFLSFDSQGRVVLVVNPSLRAGESGYRESTLMQFTPTGDLRWSRRLGGYALLGPDDSIYMFGGSITKVSPNGEIEYSLDGYGCDSSELARGKMLPAVNASGDLFLIGMKYSDSLHTPEGLDDKRRGAPDCYIARVTKSGEVAWALPMGKIRGVGSYPRQVAADDEANAFVAFTLKAGEFPTPNGFDQRHDGADVYVAKIGPSGEMEWGTYLGGTGGDSLTHIYADGEGGVIVVGRTNSPDFPTKDASQSKIRDKPDFPTKDASQSKIRGKSDVFVARIDASGKLAWSCLLAATTGDIIYFTAQDGGGNVVLCGVTESSDFPVTVGPDAVGREGHFYGIFVSKVTADGGLCWSRLFSRGKNEPVAKPNVGGGSPAGPAQLCADQAGNVYVALETDIPGLPTDNGFARKPRAGLPTHYVSARGYQARDPGDVYLAKITPSGQIAWGTYLGGNNDPYHDGETCEALLVAPNGDVTLVCKTNAEDFPTVKAFQKTMRGGADCVVTRFKSDGSLAWSSYLGGDLAETPLRASLDKDGNVALLFLTRSLDLPLPAGEKAPRLKDHDDSLVYLAVIKAE